jgi:CHAT domain-containing protein
MFLDFDLRRSTKTLLAPCLLCLFLACSSFGQAKPDPEVQKLLTAARSPGFSHEERLAKFNAALKEARARKDRPGEGESMLGVGKALQELKRLDESIEALGSAVGILREVDNKLAAAYGLKSMAAIQEAKKDKRKAISYYQEAQTLYGAANDKLGQLALLSTLGRLQFELGDVASAAQSEEKVIQLAQELQDKDSEAEANGRLGVLYGRSGQNQKALEYLQRGLEISIELKDSQSIGTAYNAIGIVHWQLGQHSKALETLQKALAHEREAKDRVMECRIGLNMGLVYTDLGQYSQALERYSNALSIAKELKHDALEGTIYSNAAGVYFKTKKYSLAADYYQKAIAIAQNTKDLYGEGMALTGLATTYESLGRHREALEKYLVALGITRKIGDRPTESMILADMSNVYTSMSQPMKAIECYAQALPIMRETDSRMTEVHTLRNIGTSSQDIRLQTVCLKAALITASDLMAGISPNALGLRRSFAETLASYSTQAAAVLIEQRRAGEAIQMLATVKSNEASFRRDTLLTPAEKAWFEEYGQKLQALVEVGKSLRQARRAKGPNADDASLQELSESLKLAQDQFTAFLLRPLQVAENEKSLSIDTPEFRLLRESLRKLPKDAVAINALPYNHNVYLILTTKSSVETRVLRNVRVGDKVVAFRRTLESARYDPRPSGKELYDVLVKPFESHLKKTKLILWNLGWSLRQVPVAALWDGRRYLIDRFENVTFNPAFPERMLHQPAKKWNAFLCYASKGASVKEPVSNRTIRFHPLAGAASEASSVQKLFPGSLVKADDSYTEKSLRQGLALRPRLVHVAGHFRFYPGDDRLSFLVTGDQRIFSVEDLKALPESSLSGIDLLTLSACSTAEGEHMDGSESESFGAWAQRKGVGAVLSTLWSIKDKTTAALMERFYFNRVQHPEYSIAACLRKAQVWLMKTSKSLQPSPQNRSVTVTSDKDDKGLVRYRFSKAHPYDHPHFWAPYVMAGGAR